MNCPRSFQEIFIEAAGTLDRMMLLYSVGVFRNEAVGYSTENLKSFLTSKLEGTSEEDKENVETAIRRLDGEQSNSGPDYSYRIPWESVSDLKDIEKVVIKTTAGDVELRLYTSETPGTVINFLKLAQEGYYDGVLFHRVVPNFVVQGGCKRGDGTSDAGYDIRSEFTSRKYETGTVGMASSGKDTEGTQFFFTHSPTPHLNGKYTAFGSVTSGMEVVEKLQVSDRIIGIERLSQ